MISTRQKHHNTRDAFQIPMLSLLPDGTPLDPGIVRPDHEGWEEQLDVFRSAIAFSLDIETYGLDHPDDGLDPWKGDIRLIQIGLLDGYTLIVDMGGREGIDPDPSTAIEEFMFVLKRKVECRKTQTVGHNLKFDFSFLAVKYDIIGRCARDTMLMSQIMWGGPKIFRHGLKPLCERLELGHIDKTEQKSDWSWKLTNSQLNYAAADAQNVLHAWMKLGELLHTDGLSGPALAECGALPAFVQMELQGMPVDWNALQDALAAYRAIESEVLEPFTKTFPEVNPASPKQLTPALNEKFNLTLEGSDQAALVDHWDIPEIRTVTVWRTLRQFIGYLEGLERSHRDGFVRSSYRQIGPKGFGRSTSGEPNLQNPPRHGTLPQELNKYNLPPVRSVFRAPDGYKLIIADLSQAHARIATECSQDKALLSVYRDDQDMHCLTASKLAAQQGLDWAHQDIDQWRKDKTHPNFKTAKKLRQLAKPTFYGSLNQQGARTLQSTAQTDGVEMSLDEAKQAISAWRETYSGLYRFQRNTLVKGNDAGKRIGSFDFGEVRGLSGRRVFLPKWPSDRGEQPSIKPTDAVSFVWSSTEADVVKLAMGEEGILADLDEHPEWSAHVANMCHDEIDLIVKEEYALEGAAALQNKMQAAMRLFIKSIPVDEPGAPPDGMIATTWNDK